MAARSKHTGIEEMLEELQTIVSRLEDGELTLEESMTAFEQGIKLTRQAQEQLVAAEQKVKVLLDENGKPRAADFTEREDS